MDKWPKYTGGLYTQVVSIRRWPKYTGGLNTQVVYIHRSSVQEVCIHRYKNANLPPPPHVLLTRVGFMVYICLLSIVLFHQSVRCSLKCVLCGKCHHKAITGSVLEVTVTAVRPGNSGDRYKLGSEHCFQTGIQAERNSRNGDSSRKMARSTGLL